MGLFDTLKKAAATRPAAETRTQSSAVSAPAIPPADRPANPGSPEDRSFEQRLLFVGHDTAWFSQMQRDIQCLQPAWRCVQAATGAQAVENWSAGSFPVLILNGRMPDAPALLKTLEKEIAHSLCLICCDTQNRATATQWKGSGATLISEESDAPALVAHVRRAALLRDWMADPAIKKIVSQIRKLPAQPKLHTQVSEELQSSRGSLETIGKLISQDPVMSAKILQVVNSAFFGFGREISDTTESVIVLGVERIKALILLAAAFSQYSGAKCAGFSIEPIWSHSVQVGSFARAIALAETKSTRAAEAAFTAGLLHDIGRLVLAGNLPEMYETVMRLRASRKVTTRDAELEILGTSHAELGACLLAAWGLPLPILEAIAWHHEPARSGEKGFTLLAAVHAANVFSQDKMAGDFVRDKIDLAYLIHAGLGDCVSRWRELCGVETDQNPDSTDELLRKRREAKEN